MLALSGQRSIYAFTCNTKIAIRKQRTKQMVFFLFVCLYTRNYGQVGNCHLLFNFACFFISVYHHLIRHQNQQFNFTIVMFYYHETKYDKTHIVFFYYTHRSCSTQPLFLQFCIALVTIWFMMFTSTNNNITNLDLMPSDGPCCVTRASYCTPLNCNIPCTVRRGVNEPS